MCYDEECHPWINPKGDWVDLRADKDYIFEPPKVNPILPIVEFSEHTIDTKVVLILPEGFCTDAIGRSSIGTKLGLQMMNSFGAIDNSYKGSSDTIKASFRAFQYTQIAKGDRIVQFRVVLSQFASFRVKLKWLFTSGIELVKTDVSNNPNRGGYGVSGKK